MRHRKANRQLRRTSEQRLALLRNLATSLIEPVSYTHLTLPTNREV